jgi:hypothetical protein
MVKKWSKSSILGFFMVFGVFDETSIFSQTQPIFEAMSIYQVLTKNPQKWSKWSKWSKS